MLNLYEVEKSALLQSHHTAQRKLDSLQLRKTPQLNKKRPLDKKNFAAETWDSASFRIFKHSMLRLDRTMLLAKILLS